MNKNPKIVKAYKVTRKIKMVKDLLLVILITKILMILNLKVNLAMSILIGMVNHLSIASIQKTSPPLFKDL
jgi:hypothetical protein